MHLQQKLRLVISTCTENTHLSWKRLLKDGQDSTFDKTGHHKLDKPKTYLTSGGTRKKSQNSYVTKLIQ